MPGCGLDSSLRQKERSHFEYTLDIVPAAILIQPPGIQLAVETGNASLSGEGRTAVYGFGFSPLGFKFDFLRRHKWQPFCATTGGLVYSLHQIPIPITDATRLNFTFDFGGGIQRVPSSTKR